MAFALRRAHRLEPTPLVTRLCLRSAKDNDEIEWQGGRVHLHLGARQDDSPLG
jgi:hypothetical protein